MNRHERRKRKAVGGDPRLDGMEIRYGGRTVEFRVFVNTDAELDELRKRTAELKECARGEKRDMVAVVVSEVDWENAEGLWSAVFGAAEKVTSRGQA